MDLISRRGSGQRRRRLLRRPPLLRLLVLAPSPPAILPALGKRWRIRLLLAMICPGRISPSSWRAGERSVGEGGACTVRSRWVPFTGKAQHTTQAPKNEQQKKRR